MRSSAQELTSPPAAKTGIPQGSPTMSLMLNPVLSTPCMQITRTKLANAALEAQIGRYPPGLCLGTLLVCLVRWFLGRRCRSFEYHGRLYRLAGILWPSKLRQPRRWLPFTQRLTNIATSKACKANRSWCVWVSLSRGPRTGTTAN